ncbi:MAG TPA: Nramp family divalent metal transporter [Lacipirellulaceae bacterium]|nr:Nramp family divalent metal transporter [Lacipirellulaceae bacterium]
MSEPIAIEVLAIALPDSAAVESDNWNPPTTQLPAWGVADLPEPISIAWSKWRSLIGPGVVMMGVQIGGGEWLFGPEITARYGGALMWLATIAIGLQLFYNLEVGRYALYCGEPIFTGFLRTRPGPRFWVPFFILLSLGAIVPGLAFHAASILATLWIGVAPTDENRQLVVVFAVGCTALAFLPVLFGRKIYSTLQAVMTVKVMGVLGFCTLVSLFFVEWSNWFSIISGFVRFGRVPSPDAAAGEATVNLFTFCLTTGRFPSIGLGEMAVIGGFIGFAGGGGLGNSLYGNYVRDKGWGNGANVGAIPPAFGGRPVPLGHRGKGLPATAENMRRWRRWWQVILIDQTAIWAPGCVVGMALPALLALQFAPYSLSRDSRTATQTIPSGSAVMPGRDYVTATARPSLDFQWGTARVTAEGMRHDARLSPRQGYVLWILMLGAGLLVLLPSQMSVVDEVCRRWTDVIWSANARVRNSVQEFDVRWIYYTIAGFYFTWCLIALHLFGTYGTPRLMTLVIGNLGNLAIGLTAFHILWINCRWLPPAIRPGCFARCGLAACGAFYLAVAALVLYESVLGFEL